MKAESEVQLSASQAQLMAVLLLRGVDAFGELTPELERAFHASLGNLLYALVGIRRTGGTVRLTALDTIAVLLLLQGLGEQPEADPLPTLH